VIALPLAAQPAKDRILRDRLETRLQQIAEALDGVMGYAVVDLTSQERFGRLEQEVFPTASTIKLAILYELFVRADGDRLALDEPRPLQRAHIVGGSGVVRELTSPVLSLRDHATLMVVLSDNTSCRRPANSRSSSRRCTKVAG
jgi:beta-lactamase class A